MTAYEHAKEFYRQFPAYDLDHDILDYTRRGYCYASPDYILLGAAWEEHESWHIYLAVGPGCLENFFKLAPYELPNITFYRPTRTGPQLRKYPYHRLEELICTRCFDEWKNLSSASLAAAVQALPHPLQSHLVPLMPHGSA